MNCFTAYEPLHSFTEITLSIAIDGGLVTARPDHASQRMFDMSFDPSRQMSSVFPNIAYAEGCDPAAGLYAFPINYDNTCEPRLDRDTEPRECTGPLTTDIVLFTVTEFSDHYDGPLGFPAGSARYCAVLTNSEASLSEGGLASDTVNAGGGMTRDNWKIGTGFRQCMNNA